MCPTHTKVSLINEYESLPQKVLNSMSLMHPNAHYGILPLLSISYPALNKSQTFPEARDTPCSFNAPMVDDNTTMVSNEELRLSNPENYEYVNISFNLFAPHHETYDESRIINKQLNSPNDFCFQPRKKYGEKHLGRFTFSLDSFFFAVDGTLQMRQFDCPLGPPQRSGFPAPEFPFN